MSEHASRSPHAARHLSHAARRTLESTNLTDVMQPVENVYRVSPLQAGILFHCLATEDAPLYVEQYMTEFEGDFDPAVLHRAWRETVAANAALRTAFVWEGMQEPLQVVLRDVTVPWTQLDWSDRDEIGPEAYDELRRSDRARPFVLTQAPLMRFTLVRLTGARHALLWSVHHLLLDGWSCALIRQEVADRYRAALAGRPADIPRRTPVVEYIRWLERQDAGAAERFWRARLAGASRTSSPLAAASTVPAPSPSPSSSASDSGARTVTKAERTLSSETTAHLHDAVRGHGLTMNTVCLAAWALTLAEYSGTDDVLFGATVSGRPPELPDIEHMVGVFINTVPVRVTIPRDARVAAWLRALQAELLDACQYDYAQLADVQRWSGLPAGAPLFDALMVYENYPGGRSADTSSSSAAAPLRIRPLDTYTRTNYPLTLTVRPGVELQIVLETAGVDVEPVMLDRLAGHVAAAIVQLMTHAEANTDVGAVSFVSQADRERIAASRRAIDGARTGGDTTRTEAAASMPSPEAPGHGTPAYQPPRDALELELVQLWKTLLGARAVGIRDTFTSHGGHSILLLRLASRIERGFGTRLPLAMLVQDTTIERLAALIRERRPNAPESRLVPLRTEGDGLPCFAIVPAGGTLACYLALADHMGPMRPFHALQPRAPFDDAERLPSIEEIARDDLDELRRVQPSGPYALIGWSMGGLVAYEMARQLREAGETVRFLALLDAGVPDPEAPARDATDAAVQLAANHLTLGPADLGDAQGAARLDALIALAQARGRLTNDGDVWWVRWLMHGYRLGVDAVQRYRPLPYDGRLTLIRAADASGGGDALGWDAIARGGVELRIVPGTHQTMVQPPQVAVLAGWLRADLNDADRSAERAVAEKEGHVH